MLHLILQNTSIPMEHHSFSLHLSFDSSEMHSTKSTSILKIHTFAIKGRRIVVSPRILYLRFCRLTSACLLSDFPGMWLLKYACFSKPAERWITNGNRKIHGHLEGNSLPIQRCHSSQLSMAPPEWLLGSSVGDFRDLLFRGTLNSPKIFLLT